MSKNKTTRLRAVGPKTNPPSREPLSLAVDPSPEIDHPTDLGNAARLADRHGGTLRWVEGRGWMKWSGAVWVADQLQAHRCHIETNRWYGKRPEGLHLWTWLEDSEERSRISAAVDLAKAFLPLDVGELDRDPWLLNVRNGTVDLHTGALREHRAEDLITRIADVEYDPGASCPTFDTFLAQVFDGDDEVISYAQRALGYTLIGETSEQVLFFATGRGANGKSTLLELVRDLLGDYALAIPSDTLTRRGEREPYEVADLPGKRLVTAVESDVDRKLAEGLVKAVTGSDTIPARKIRQDPFTFKPQFTLWVATNHLPRIEGTDHAIWRRIKVIDFPRTFTGAEQDKDLPLKLRAEAAGGFRWLVEGAVAYLQDGLREPAAVTQAIAAFRESQDILGQWVTDWVELTESAWTSSRDLLTSHKQWAEANAVDPLSTKALTAKLAERGLRAGKQRGQRGWHGIRIVDAVGR